MTEALEPFDVSGGEVAALGARFTDFVNKLLAQEAAAANMSGHQLRTNYHENVPDGGVDAALIGSPGTTWLPPGDSAWQFKRSDLPPAACKRELRDAQWAKERVAKGASYRLALGVPLTDRQIEDRLTALREQAGEEGLPHDADRFAVLDANMLARWASRHPAMALSSLFGKLGPLLITHDVWSRSSVHQSSWTVDPARQEQIDAIRGAIDNPAVRDIRVEGVSGSGKSRLVMEAVRPVEYSSIVVYMQQADDPNIYLSHLLTSGRSVILVADECSRRKYENLRELVPHDAPVTLIAIGPPDDTTYLLPSGLLSVDRMAEEALERLLEVDHPGLPLEARRFVTRHTAGNVKMTIFAAQLLERGGDISATDLVRANDWDGLLQRALPHGGAFFAAAVLSLFSRVGWDSEAAYQAEMLQRLSGASMEDVRSAIAQLDQAGLLVRQGRYRAVAPHPLAVFLAENAWRTAPDLLTDVVFPALDSAMAGAFLSRAADLGDFEPTRFAATRWLTTLPQFRSVDALAEHRAGNLLTQIAIVAPEASLRRLEDWLAEASDSQLREQTAVRRDLVWTLEKLVWHSRLFERAADSLLRLAKAENETFANNATGTWTGLFSGPLPNTSAGPAQRLKYLQAVLDRRSEADVMLAIGAAGAALGQHGTVMVSGELQAGRLVEPRGGVQSWNEAWDFQSQLVGLLAARFYDDRADVRDAAEEAVCSAVHGSLETPVLDSILETVPRMSESGVRRLRQELAELESLYRRVPEHPGRVAGLARLSSSLPAEEPEERLAVLLQLQRWDFDEAEFQVKVTQAYLAMGDSAERAAAVARQLEKPVKAGFEIGFAVGLDPDASQFLLERFTDLAANDLSILTGFLTARVQSGHGEAFNEYLASPRSKRLPAPTRVALAVRGPRDQTAVDRVMAEVSRLTPADGAVALFGWHRELSQVELSGLIQGWLTQIGNQRDYNRTVDFVAMSLHQVDEWSPELQSAVSRLLELRRSFPDVGQERWDWAALARYELDAAPASVAGLLFELAQSGATYLFGGDEDAELIRAAFARDAHAVWADLAGRLEGDAWRLQIDLRSWLIPAVPPDVVTDWIGSDVTRARRIAGLVSPVGSEPSPVVLYLLDNFDDDEIGRSLYGGLVSGTWMGPESERIAGQIAQLDLWLEHPSPGVRAWALRTRSWLEQSRERALQREAEEFG